MTNKNFITEKDFHCHTAYFACAKPEMLPMKIFPLLKQQNVKVLGISEHLFPRIIAENNNWNFPQIMKNIRNEFSHYCPDDIELYFAVEACLLNHKGELAGQNDALLDEISPDYILAGAHHIHLPWVEADFKGNWNKFLCNQHLALLNACQNPYCTAIAHPWVITANVLNSFDLPTIEDYSVIPEEMVAELGIASAETKTGLEVNSDALKRSNYSHLSDKNWLHLLETYKNFLQILIENNALLFSGSDAHELKALKEPEYLWKVLNLNIPEKQHWEPKHRNN